MKAFIPLYVVVFALVASTSVADQETDNAATNTSPTASPGVDLFTIMSSVSQRAHKKFLIAPGVHASVNLIGLEPREVSYSLLLSILAAHGFSAYQREGVIVVGPDFNERQVAPGPEAFDIAHAADDDIVTTVVEVKNSSAAMLVPVLRPLMPQNAQLASAIDHNALIIVDRAANVRRMIAIINELEKLPITKTQ